MYITKINCKVPEGVQAFSITIKHARLRVLYGKEMGFKHISISHPTRYPTWDEITKIKNYFCEDTKMVMYLPKPEEYVNLHPNCFHLWQASPDEPDQIGINLYSLLDAKLSLADKGGYDFNIQTHRHKFLEMIEQKIRDGSSWINLSDGTTYELSFIPKHKP